MPTTGAPWSIYYPDNTAPISPIENLFSTLATSVAAALTAALAKAPYVVTTPAALDVIADATAGSLAYMTTPATGLTAMNWRALSTGSGAGIDWQIEDDYLVVDTQAHLDSFITTLAGLAGTDLQVKIGGRVYITGTNQTLIFTSTAGAYRFAPGEIVSEVEHAKGAGQALSTTAATDLTGMTLTVVTKAEKIRIFADVVLSNPNSGANQTCNLQILQDGVVIGDVLAVGLPLVSGFNVGYSFHFEASVTATAASHVYKVQAAVGVANGAFFNQGYLRIEGAVA